MKPVCIPCQRFYRPAKTGLPFIEGMPTSNGTEPGLAEPENWKPYKLWSGDRWVCPDCGASIIVGVAHRPISEHYKPEFTELVEAYEVHHGKLLQVNDC